MNPSTRITCALIALILLATPLPGQEKVEQAEAPERAVLFSLEGQLAQTMTMSLKRAIRRAEELSARTLIVEINTPGGEMVLMEQLRDMLLVDAYQDRGLNTVAYVTRNADSAGALIAIACQQLYMNRISHMGSATPVAINPLAPLAPFLPQQQGQEDMTNKIKSRARAVFRTTAVETGRNEYIAEAMVDPDIELVLALVEDEEQILSRLKLNEKQSQLGDSKVIEMSIVCAKGALLNMTAREALEWGFIDGIPDSRDQLVRDFLKIEEANLYIVKPSWSESLVSFLEKINFILLIAGLILLYIEFHVPGFGIPGIAGLACLGILFLGKYMVGLAEFTELLMIVGGLGLIAVEIFVIPGTFAAGIAGGLLVLGGLILSFQPFVVPESPWQTDLFLNNITYLGLSVIVVLISAALLSRFLPRSSVFKPLVLDTNNPPGSLHGTGTLIDDVSPELKLKPGDTGVVESTLRPSGKVLIKDTIIDAQSEGGFIEPGEKVEIISVKGNFIFVRKIKDNQS